MWLPNVHNKRLWSNYLGRFLKVKVTSRVLRTLDKLGGLDEYLVGSDAPARIKELGVIGWELRWRVMQTKGYRERVLAQRRELGLPERGWAVEEKERKRAERREALRVAEAYLDAVKAEEGGATAKMRAAESVEEAVEQAAEEAVEKLEASAAANEQEEFDEEGEREFEEEEEEEGKAKAATEQNRNAVQHHDEAVELATSEEAVLPPSQQLYARLTAIATEINSHPHSLIKQARDLIANRAAQSIATSAEKSRLAIERAAHVSAIDAALASPKRGAILSLYATQITRAQDEDALQREREGKKPLTPRQMELNVLGPPSNVPAEKWAEVRARVRAIRREMPRRLKERRDRAVASEGRKRYREEHREEVEREKRRRWRRLGLLKRWRYSVARWGEGGWFGWVFRGLAGVGKGKVKAREGRQAVGRVRGS